MLFEAELKEDQLVRNPMTSEWPGQLGNASICVSLQTSLASSSADSITSTTIGSPDRGLKY